MPKIQRLSTSVINKIAAGEVIERPASVVKELVENSVDAGATRIDVSVSKGGTELIRVVDDGCGIAADEMMLAIASHATSKISDADDLFSVGTLGFRGEAMASIAEISHFRIRTRQADSEEGSELQVIGGEASEVLACGCRPGCEMEVRNLFFNTPVRRRFMRTTQTEMGHISEAVTRIALPNPHIHFTLSHNDRLLLELPPCDDARSRIEKLFGRELADALIWIEADEDPIRMSGYVANPSHDRSNNRMQYLFLNGRYIRDRALGHALREAYRGLLMTGRFAVAFLNIEMPLDQVDVNVHPTKTEVRFIDGGRLYGQLLGSIRSKFLETDLTAHAQLNRAAAPAEDVPVTPTVDEGWQQRRMALDFNPARSTESVGPRTSSVPDFRPYPAAAHHAEAWSPPPQSTGTSSFQRSDFEPMPSQDEITIPGQIVHSDEGTPAMQVYNRYLITESDDGMMVIDQHALHERVLYEELREKVLGKNLEVQKLLVPEPVQLTSAECAAVVDQSSTLQRLGIDLEQVNSTTVMVASYPAMLSNLPPAAMLRQVAAKLVDVPPQEPGQPAPIDERDLVDELLHLISCKAAIKAGDPLTSEEIAALLRRRHYVQDSHHCPHGRPTTLVFSREELDRRFKRI